MAPGGALVTGPRRGDIYWADLDPVRGQEQGGRRPVLVLSHDLFNTRSRTVIAMAITSQPQRAPYPLTLRLPEGVLPRTSCVKVSQVRTLALDRLEGPVARLDEEALGLVVQGLQQLIA